MGEEGAGFYPGGSLLLFFFAGEGQRLCSAGPSRPSGVGAISVGTQTPEGENHTGTSYFNQQEAPLTSPGW